MLRTATTQKVQRARTARGATGFTVVISIKVFAEGRHAGVKSSVMRLRETMRKGACMADDAMPLVIDSTVRENVAAVVAYARENRLPMARLLGAMHDEGYVAPGDDPRRVVHIPTCYRCVYTEESQPQGLCRHLSVSIGRKGEVPSDDAVQLIMGLFGFKSPKVEDALACYVEDTDAPGIQAVSVVEIMV